MNPDLSEINWPLLLDNAPVGFWLIDPEKRTLLVNRFLAGLMGYAPEEMVGWTPLDFVDAANRPVFEAQLAQVATTAHRHYEVALRSREGETIPTSFSATTLRDSQGRLQGSFAFVTDLRAAKEHERALADSRETLLDQQAFVDEVIDRLPGAFYAFDDQGRMLLWNSHLETAWGYSSQAIRGGSFEEFFTPASKPAIQEGIGDAFSQGQGAAEGFVAASDGSKLPYRFQTSRLDGYGRPLAVGLGLNIHYEKAVEASLERSNRVLRTLHQANEALVQAESEDQLLDQLCAILTGEGNYSGAWVGFITNEDPAYLQVQAARAQEGRPALASGDSFPLDQPAIEGNPFQTAVREGTPRRLTGVLLPHNVLPSSPEAGAFQDKNLAILPIGSQPVRGLMVVCSWDPDSFSGNEMSLLAELAGDLDYGIGVLRLRNERLQHLAALRRSATVFEHSAEGIIITDPQTQIVAVNDAFTRITGYTESEVLGQTPRMLSSGLQGADFYRTMWVALEQQGVWRGEIWNRRKNGEAYPEWLTISEVRDDSGDLCNYVAVFSDITKARKTEEELTHLTYYDPLTDLPNRALFREHLGHALASIDRSHQILAVINLDLEGFGRINDSLGPQVGDSVLKTAAQRLRQSLREGDTVSRPGGDEIWILLEDLQHGEDSSKVVHQILAELAAPLTVHGRTLRLEAAAGIALAPFDGTSVDEVLNNASTALHRAQACPTRPVQFFSKDMGDKASRRLDLEHALKRALEEEELEAWFQPQVSPATGEVLAAEALVRWHHPDWGLVSPSQFIPIAEDSGLVVPLGEWMLAQAIQQVAKWRAQGLPVQRIGVNVAAAQLQSTNFPQKVADQLQQAGLPPHCLELEITEEGLLADVDPALATLHELAEQGTRLAIDDFGTGYSSLAYLKRLPVDTLKIDKAFIDGLPDDDHDRSIVEAVLAVANQMGLETVPEGVETTEQAAWITQQGIRCAQGFLWSRPQPPGELEQWLTPPS